MATLTAGQAFQLALGFHNLAQEIASYRFEDWDNLTSTQRRNLERLENQVRNFSSDFNALSIKLVLDDLSGTLKNIDEATAEMTKAVKRIKKIDKILKIAAAGVTLGAAILAGNPSAIASAIGGAVTSAKDNT